jgi:hypothetical protein
LENVAWVECLETQQNPLVIYFTIWIEYTKLSRTLDVLGFLRQPNLQGELICSVSFLHQPNGKLALGAYWADFV